MHYILVRLSKDVFERRTSTGSGLFFFNFGRCFSSDFWTSRLSNSKNTWKYKFGTVKVLENEKDLTSG